MPRFKFGQNWARFLEVLDDERIEEARKSLLSFLGDANLEGKTFVDVGSGSGLFSLAARQLGADVHSFDYDEQSVACTRKLQTRFYPHDSHWRIEQGSVLDQAYLETLRTYDIVYSWGVLHHTGDMWQALENVIALTKPNGKLFVAIYNDYGDGSRRWLKIKRFYNTLPDFLKLPFAFAVWGPIELRSILYHLRARDKTLSDYLDIWRNYKQSRGMSRWHDMIDWIGGYPYEFATIDQLTDFYERRGFKTLKTVPNFGSGCHQVVFERHPEA